MKMNIKLMALTIISCIVASCDSPTDSDDTEPSFQISGTVTLAGDWPVTGQVLVNLFSKDDIDSGDYSSVHDFEALTLDDLVYTFEDVSVGEYYLFLSWYDIYDSNPATNQHVFGYYGTATAPYFTAVSMTETENMVTVDFTGNLDFICNDSPICLP